jgi:drug/metabolite transporter (DMT)-like permease
MNMWLQVLFALSSISLFVFVDYTSTRWVELVPTEGYWTLRLLGVLIAAPLGALAFGWVATRLGLAAVAALINTGIVVGGVFVGILIRGDQLTAGQKVGLVLGLVAMVLLCLGRGEPNSVTPSDIDP